MAGKNTYYEGLYENRIYDVEATTSSTSIDFSEGNIINLLLNSDTTVSLNNINNGYNYLIVEQGANHTINFEADVLFTSGIISPMTQIIGAKQLYKIVKTPTSILVTVCSNMINNEPYIQVEIQDVADFTALSVYVGPNISKFEFWSDLGLESTQNTNSSNHTWSGTTNKKVRFFPPNGDFALVVGILNWSSKNLKGPIDKNFGLLTNVQQLRLNFNELTGIIPPELGNLTNLTWLYLYSNKLSGSIPSELGNLNNLQRLYLYSNELSAIATPWSVSSATTLFRADNNQLTNPAHINEILVRFDLAGVVNATINISGGTNAAPDGTSGGFDGITAKANLIGKGCTVTTN